jgi:hypothetical protein
MLGGGSVIGGYAFGQGVTSSDPAFLRILTKSNATDKPSRDQLALLPSRFF